MLASGNLPFPTPRKKYGLFGADHPRFSTYASLFQNSGFTQAVSREEADFIYISIPHIEGVNQESPEVFLKDVQEVPKDIPFLCANPDHFAHEGNPPRLVVRQGTLAQMLQEQGASVYFIGKPYSSVYEKALRLFPDLVHPCEVLMVGDTPETDMRGARRMGLATALVTKTGVMRERIGEKKPFEVIDQLPHKDQPDYVIDRF